MAEMGKTIVVYFNQFFIGSQSISQLRDGLEQLTEIFCLHEIDIKETA